MFTLFDASPRPSLHSFRSFVFFRMNFDLASTPLEMENGGHISFCLAFVCAIFSHLPRKCRHTHDSEHKVKCNYCSMTIIECACTVYTVWQRSAALIITITLKPNLSQKLTHMQPFDCLLEMGCNSIITKRHLSFILPIRFKLQLSITIMLRDIHLVYMMYIQLFSSNQEIFALVSFSVSFSYTLLFKKSSCFPIPFIPFNSFVC